MLVLLFTKNLPSIFFDFFCIERYYITYTRMREQFCLSISNHPFSSCYLYVHVTFTSFHSLLILCIWHPVLSCAMHVVLCCVVLFCSARRSLCRPTSLFVFSNLYWKQFSTQMYNLLLITNKIRFKV